MIPGAAIYTQYQKATHFTRAMVKGFPAKEVPSAQGKLDPESSLHIFGGLQFGSFDLMKQVRANQKSAVGLEFIFWDRAYFGGGSKTDRLRITMNAYHKCWTDPRHTLDRFRAFGGKLAPWRKSGSHIMVVPPGLFITTMGNPNAIDQWMELRLADLRASTDRPIMVSKKGDPRPLEERLKNCHAVVTFTSNVSVDALCAGVPVFASPMSPAGELALPLTWLADPDKLENPPLLDRVDWAASLAWGQFTIAEIESGFARDVVMNRYVISAQRRRV